MLKTFRIGGVHPPENKLSAGQAIITADLPKQAVVMLSQHIGAPAQAVVAKGDKVKVGTLLAQAGGFVSAQHSLPRIRNCLQNRYGYRCRRFPTTGYHHRCRRR